MLYILCEDSSMGYDFWRLFNKYCLKSKAKLYTSKGISKMCEKLDIIPLSDNDILFCAFDNVGSNECYKFMQKLKLDSVTRNYRYLLSNYYCIEEVFLSFNDLIRWLNINDLYLQGICNDIYNYIYDTKNNFNYLYDNRLQSEFPLANTREQMASYFLTYISNIRGKGFSISKGHFGKCWYCDCLNDKQFPYYCKYNNCSLYFDYINNIPITYLDSYGKFSYLWNNSVLVKSKYTIQTLYNLC